MEMMGEMVSLCLKEKRTNRRTGKQNVHQCKMFRLSESLSAGIAALWGNAF